MSPEPELHVSMPEPPGGTTAVLAPVEARRRLMRFGVHSLEAYALLILLVLIAVFFTFWSKTADTFLTSANLRILVANQAVTAIIALGALIPLVCNEFDLSVGATAGVAAVFVADAISNGMPVLAAILLGIAIGALVGGVNAVLVTRMGVNGVITTLGTSTILAGVVSQKTGGLSIVSNIPASVTKFGGGTWIGIPRVAFALALVALGVYYLLGHTPLGRYTYAFGSNRAAARLVGVRTNVVLAVSFVLAGALSGAAGVLSVARAGGADPNVGPGFTLPALAAAFLSAAAIKPGRYNVGGTLVAIFFLAVLNSGLNLAGAAPYVSSYVNGVALIIGVGLAVLLARKKRGS
jgi:ribose transport system permease protein